ncbi:short-chain collagen C4-like isoform X2 [Mercenaria mercenaria]|uniref:short-chain collagen C4-like isoform X2 n=1 Tax=Mercenaria mercenaria TaxID=6596 RepID=UPI00234F413E|nr:short-chain collagen C4-like isoform X2 [Mercenaria mercenaria]
MEMLLLKYGHHLLLAFCAVQVISAVEKPTRMLFHSEGDMAAELIRLRAELANTTQQLGAVLSEVTVLKKEINSIGSTQQSFSNKLSGSVYVRWGKKTCPNGAEMVYHGYSGGKLYTDQGSGSDSLCLPSDPTWGHYVDGYQDYRAAIYGTETDMPTHPFFKYEVNQQDMPCAVCKSNRSTTLMIPARKDCYPVWTLEYSGYLVSASSNHHVSYNHACLDAQPDFLDHGSANDNEHIFHLVEGHCGSLPCPPYVAGRELTCVVCSK